MTAFTIKPPSTSLDISGHETQTNPSESGAKLILYSTPSEGMEELHRELALHRQTDGKRATVSPLTRKIDLAVERVARVIVNLMEGSSNERRGRFSHMAAAREALTPQNTEAIDALFFVAQQRSPQIELTVAKSLSDVQKYWIKHRAGLLLETCMNK